MQQMRFKRSLFISGVLSWGAKNLNSKINIRIKVVLQKNYSSVVV